MRSGVIGWLLLGLLAGCGNPHRIPPDARVLAVPAIEQVGPDGCALAAADSLARFHGRSLPTEERERLLLVAEESGGNSAAEIRSLLQLAGFEAFVVSGNSGPGPLGLAGNLAQGRPILTYLADRRDSHAVLVIGSSTSHRAWIVLDPFDALPRRVGHKRFDQLWKTTEHLAIIAAPP